jgi:hypothetical protein
VETICHQWLAFCVSCFRGWDETCNLQCWCVGHKFVPARSGWVHWWSVTLPSRKALMMSPRAFNFRKVQTAQTWSDATDLHLESFFLGCVRRTTSGCGRHSAQSLVFCSPECQVLRNLSVRMTRHPSCFEFHVLCRSRNVIVTEGAMDGWSDRIRGVRGRGV